MKEGYVIMEAKVWDLRMYVVGLKMECGYVPSKKRWWLLEAGNGKG